MRQLSSYYLNPLALCLYVGLVLAGFFLDYRSHHFNQLPLLLTLSAVVAAWAWAFNFRRFLGISEVPISTIASAAQGYVELFGKSRQLVPTSSPIQGVNCVWFRLWVYVRDTNYIWRLADYQISEQLFELQDASGACRVDPQGAEVFAASRHVIVQHDHKFIEDVLYADKPIYVLGDLDTGSQRDHQSEIYNDVSKLMTQWKQSKFRLLQRFDLNRDDEVDMHEWALAREQAYAEVKCQHAQRLKSEVHLMAKPTKGLFLISGISPHVLKQRYRYWAVVHFTLFFLALIFSFIIHALAT